MAKLKNIIKQLSLRDFQAIHDSLIESSAEKSAYLMKSIRDKELSDTKIMQELGVNTNAYYTLRSRLNQKIEEYLLQQMESPRTDILKKVANINEIIFTKKRAISIATLKKLEKELLDYDLSNELTIVYKSLKKLHINSPEHFSYSQLYNRHVAYTLAVDKAEDILAEYFKKYGYFKLSGEKTDKLALELLLKELGNVKDLYESHRLYIYHSCVEIFHRLFIAEDADDLNEDYEPIEDIFDKVAEIFNSYELDSIYYHLNLVFEYLKLEYYNHYKVYRKAEKYYEEVNDAADNLLTNYTLYTYPAQFLISKMERHLRQGTEDSISEEVDGMFQDFEFEKEDLPTFITYSVFRAYASYYSGSYVEASKWLNGLMNESGLKKYPLVFVELKLLLALQYCIIRDYELFNQLINSIQRQIRILGKKSCDHLMILTKILKIAISEIKKNKAEKIQELLEAYPKKEFEHFSPINLLKMGDDFVARLCLKDQ